MKTKNKFGVSVIIPVFNAESFVKKAVISAINQAEVNEVILIEDGSIDKSLQICRKLEAEYPIVKLWQHKNGQNRGRSATKNLGIKKASQPYLAFLDADDYYLPGRFITDKEKFQKHPEIDGVYNAIGATFYREPLQGEEEKLKLTTLTAYVEPKDLFRFMYPVGHLGFFSGIGLTVKKSLLEITGTFNQNLEVAEDTELWVRMSLKGKLIPGNINKPVAMRGVHGNNVSFRDKPLYLTNNKKMFENLLDWASQNEISRKNREILWDRNCRIRKNSGNSEMELMRFAARKLRQYPSLLFSKHTYRYFSVTKQLKKIFQI